jgi:hypothetical protein
LNGGRLIATFMLKAFKTVVVDTPSTLEVYSISNVLFAILPLYAFGRTIGNIISYHLLLETKL